MFVGHSKRKPCARKLSSRKCAVQRVNDRPRTECFYSWIRKNTQPRFLVNALSAKSLTAHALRTHPVCAPVRVPGQLVGVCYDTNTK